MSLAGRQFAYRDHPKTVGEPVEPIEVVREGPPRTKKVLIRFLSGEREGREKWVPEGRLLVPWEEGEAFCRDEELLLAARKASDNVFETVPWEAAEWVFTATSERWGRQFVYCGHRADDRNLLVIDDFDEAVSALDLPRDGLLSKPHAYVDRLGTYRAPSSVAEELAKSFCRQFPDEIVEYVEKEDKQHILRQAERDPDGSEDSFYTRYLRTQRLAIAVAREWCGGDAVDRHREVQTLKEEIDRLRGIIESLVRWLKDEDYDTEAEWLLNQMNDCSQG